MRFYADGPSIPDSLLELRDQGRVVFFCGAGVSKNEGVDDFEQLTQAVINHFDPPEYFESHKIFYDQYKNHSLPVLDQVFYFLHEEFGREEVNRFVAEQLSNQSTDKTKSHRDILRISANLDDIPQVVTTNFDHLFEISAANTISSYEAPALPNLEFNNSLSGIIYLHGKLNSSQSGEHDYILSSADFGRAYLSQGWATEFVRSLLQNYTVVLLGYQAEDAPIKYLLQGLKHHKTNEQFPIYTFDALTDGMTAELMERKWRDKGVIPIIATGFQSLWSSIDAWAERADAPRTWREKTLQLAIKKPEELEAFERGKIAHIVSTAAGAKAFTALKPVPPPEWLCVFDSKCRTASTAKNLFEKTSFNPLEAYGLDDDPSETELKGNRENYELKNLLHWQSIDIKNTRPLDLVDTRQDMPQRLFELTRWITLIVDSPVTVWWVFKQDKLHLRLIDMLSSAISRKDALSTKAKCYWGLAIDYHRRQYFLEREVEFKFDLIDSVKNDGWTNDVLRKFEKLITPVINIEKASGLGRVKPPNDSWEGIEPLYFATWKIKGFDIGTDKLDISEEALPKVFRILETQLLKQGELRSDLPEFSLGSPTCYKIREVSGRHYEGDELFDVFLTVFEQLIDSQPELAKAHIMTWQTSNTEYFGILKLFALNKPRLFSSEEVFDYLSELKDPDIWNPDSRRELLFLIMDRFSEFSQDQQYSLIQQLLNGPQHYNDFSKDEITIEACRYVRRLQLGGVEICPEQQRLFDERSQSLPDWSDEWAKHITSINNGDSYIVSTDEDATSLNNLPVSSVVDVVASMDERQPGERVDKKPFIGLVKASPKKAFLALAIKRRKGELPCELWEQLIQNFSLDIPSRYLTLFLARLSTLPPSVLSTLSYSLARWMEEHLVFLIDNHSEQFWQLFDQMIESMQETTDLKVVEQSGSYGVASYSPEGIFVEKILFPRINQLNLDKDAGIPTHFKVRLERLLNLPTVKSENVTAAISHALSGMSCIDPAWIMENITPLFQLDNPKAKAAWDGYLTSQIPWLRKGIAEAIYSIFPKLLQHIKTNGWNENLSNRAAIIIVELVLNGGDDNWKMSFDEMRNCLRVMPLKSVQSVINRLKNIGQSNQSDWSEKVIPFIVIAWPKEKVFQQTGLTTSWLYLLASTKDEFPAVLNTVYPFLRTVHGYGTALHSFYYSLNDVPLAKQFPQDMLRLLDKLTADSPDVIPYETPKILETIIEADPTLLTTPKYKRLIRIVEGD